MKSTQEYKDLEKIVQTYDEYRNTVENIVSAKDILSNEKDPEFREMAKMELDELTTAQNDLEERIKVLLIPKDEEDAKLYRKHVGEK